VNHNTGIAPLTGSEGLLHLNNTILKDGRKQNHYLSNRRRKHENRNPAGG
jgi:hypothetical protein